MSYRFSIDTLPEYLTEIDRRLRVLEQPGALPPDPGWVLRQVGTTLLYVYVPSGAVGPVIGTQ